MTFFEKEYTVQRSGLTQNILTGNSGRAPKEGINFEGVYATKKICTQALSPATIHVPICHLSFPHLYPNGDVFRSRFYKSNSSLHKPPPATGL